MSSLLYGGGPCDHCDTPVPFGLGFEFGSALGLGIRGPDLGLGLENWPNFFRLPITDYPLCSPRSSDRTRWLAKQRTHWHGNSSPMVAAPLKHEL